MAKVCNAFMRLPTFLSFRKPKFSALLAPEQTFWAIGDVHGRVDLLDRLLPRLKDQGPPKTPLIFVGDYVDRGENSAGTLRRLMELQAGGWFGEVICLKGNHEDMLLTFLDFPLESGPDWMRCGGNHTVASFGLKPLLSEASEADWMVLRDALIVALGEPRIEWLKALPTSWRSGNVFVCHAGADPKTPVADQVDEVLMWGAPEFTTRPRQDEIWVVHGHTIQEKVAANTGRLGIDTGAYATGILSAVRIEHGSFTTVQSSGSHR